MRLQRRKSVDASTATSMDITKCGKAKGKTATKEEKATACLRFTSIFPGTAGNSTTIKVTNFTWAKYVKK